MEMTVNLENIREFIEGEDFHQFLVSHTTDFGTATWVLQTLLEAYFEAKEKLAAASSQDENESPEETD